MSFPPFTDLQALASKLKANGKHAVLQKTLMQAWRAESCHGDLKQSKDCCGVLRELLGRPKADYPPAMHTTERALLTTAILLYARATSTSGKAEERGSIQLERGLLTNDQWQDHQELIGVRNQSLAHVNPAHTVGSRIWHKVMLFAVLTPGGSWRAASATNETTFHTETLVRLERMLPVANEIVLRKFNKRILAVTTQLNDAGIEERIFFEHQFNPVEFFGSEDIVKRLLKGSSKETDAFWVND